jgi:hypothetical protein
MAVKSSRNAFSGFSAEERVAVLGFHQGQLRRWVSWRTEENIPTDFQRELRLAHSQPDAVHRVIYSIGSARVLGNFQLAKAAAEILDGTEQSWGAFRAALRLWYWSDRGEAAIALGQPFSAILPSVSTRMYPLMHVAQAAFLLGDRTIADWAFGRVLEMHKRDVAEKSFVSDFAYLEYFVAFAEMYFDPSVTRRGPWRHPSALTAMLDAIDDSALLASALPRAVDYHLWRSDVRKRARNPEEDYAVSGLTMMPVSALAFLKLRRDRGAAEVTFEHPVLDLPICQIPDSVPLPADDMISIIEAHVLALEQEHGLTQTPRWPTW